MYVPAPRKRPRITLPIRYCCLVIESPACWMRVAKLTRCLPFFSMSRRPSAICFLRAVLSTTAATRKALASLLVTAARRLSARDSPATNANARPPNPMAKHPATTIGLTIANHPSGSSQNRRLPPAPEAILKHLPRATALGPAADFRHVQGGGETRFLSVNSRPVPKSRPPDSCRSMPPF